MRIHSYFSRESKKISGEKNLVVEIDCRGKYYKVGEMKSFLEELPKFIYKNIRFSIQHNNSKRPNKINIPFVGD